MRNVLVTGGAGFIGSALVRGLLAEKGVERVVVVDNLLTGKDENLAEVRESVEVHTVDVRDYDALEPLFAGIDVVFHQAAVPSVPRSIEEPELCHEINVNGAFNVFLAAHRKKVRRVVYAASSSAYGDSEVLPKTETMAPSPMSPYAVQKLLGEYYGRTFFESFGLETVSLRYFNVFGPRQDPGSPYSGVLSLFCTAVLERRSPTIYGDGKQTRDFTFIDNVVRLNLLAARSPKAPGNVYNGGTGARVTINDVWRILQRLEKVEIAPTYGPPRQGDIRHSLADLTSARRDLSFEPTVALDEGLRRTLDWYRSSESP